MTDIAPEQAPDDITTTEPVTTDDGSTDETTPPEPEGQAPEQDAPESPRMGNREAAKYRVERNEVRAERDRLAERIATYERRQLDRLASDRLADPSDWQPDLDQLRDEDGNLDEDKAAAHLDELLTAKPHYAKHKPPLRSGGPIAGGNNTGSAPRMGGIFSG